MKANLCGKRIKLARVNKEMAQVDLAAALSVDYELDLQQTRISAIERGERHVGDKELVAIADILDVTVEWLVFGDKGDPRTKKI